MAIKFPKFFSAADAKSRIFLIFAAVVIFGLLIYMAIRFLGGGGGGGASRIANAPSNLQSVPGGQMSPEFYRAVQQANQQAAQQAQISGGSAVPTLINVPNQQQATSFPQEQGNCTVLCSDQAIDVANDINDLVKAGALSQDEANKLKALAKNNVSISEYSAALNELVRQGKLTPEQARKLLENYKKQYQNGLNNQNAQAMDTLIKSGELPLETANALLTLQKSNISPADYAAELNQLVKEGKIMPATMSRLLGQYTQTRGQEAAKESEFGLRQLAKSGEITGEVAQTLAGLQKANVPVEQYAAQLNQLVSAGKMTPAAAAKLLDQYRKQRAAIGAMGTLNASLGQEEANSVNQLSDLLKAGKISSDTANALFALQQKNVSPEEYQAAIDSLVKAGKLSPEDAKKLIAQYQKLASTRAIAKQLSTLQGNNASAADYAAALKQAVKAGVITPEMAANLLQEYKGVISPGITPTTETSIPGAEGFAKLQQRVQQQQVTGPTTTVIETEQFSEAAMQAEAQAAQAQQDRIQKLAAAMSSQAQSLITAWQPPIMKHVGGTEAGDKSKQGEGPGENGKGSTTTIEKTVTGPVMIKAGTILFAVLDTGVDSDYPDTPVLATIVSGEFKGAKLLGKIQVTNNASGVTQNDRVAMTFNLMNKDEWPKSRTVSAFAIDPDTARTIMASSVDYHYLKRYGALFAGSFMSGYSSAITQSGATNTTGIFGTSTTTSPISPAGKLAVGLGQVGTALTNAVSSYVNIPPTVKVNSGVGLGILFMSDVSA